MSSSRVLMLSFTRLAAVVLSADGGIYTAVIEMLVNSLGRYFGLKDTKRNSTFGQQC